MQLSATGFFFKNCVVPENIHTPPKGGFLFYTPFPQEILVYFIQYIAFKTPSLPLGYSNDLSWGSMDFFLELHIVIALKSWGAYFLVIG